ncbi:uncharacterized protein LOC120703377 isoform X2 [Panicum virgatum]|uniref:uncharacterized protein LOC120703377 isoform X2 n=1 Tax=Panicum virgatum TaxID=38727 RepID=UPI0019D6724B|nr:uncharacterized protein LOC120703377 isoform X2 [Panicum virgatum]
MENREKRFLQLKNMVHHRRSYSQRASNDSAFLQAFRWAKLFDAWTDIPPDEEHGASITYSPTIIEHPTSLPITEQMTGERRIYNGVSRAQYCLARCTDAISEFIEGGQGHRFFWITEEQILFTVYMLTCNDSY